MGLSILFKMSTHEFGVVVCIQQKPTAETPKRSASCDDQNGRNEPSGFQLFDTKLCIVSSQLLSGTPTSYKAGLSLSNVSYK